MELEGNVPEINLVESLVKLTAEGFTGAVRFERDGVIKILYFREGSVVSASTNDRSDGIDELLLRGGKITRDHIKQALSRRDEEESLGEALLAAGFITRKELLWAKRTQIVGILRSVQRWPDGSYAIVHDHRPRHEDVVAFPFEQIILELLVTDKDRERTEKALAGGTRVFCRTADFSIRYSRLDLNAEADRIVAKVDGERSAGEIAAEAVRDEFTVYKLLHALEVLGLLDEAKPQVMDEVLLPGVMRAERSAMTAETAHAEDASHGDALDRVASRTSEPVEPIPEESLSDDSIDDIGSDDLSWDEALDADEAGASVGTAPALGAGVETGVGEWSEFPSEPTASATEEPLDRSASVLAPPTRGLAGIPWPLVGVVVMLVVGAAGVWVYQKWAPSQREQDSLAVDARATQLVIPPMPAAETAPPNDEEPGQGQPSAPDEITPSSTPKDVQKSATSTVAGRSSGGVSTAPSATADAERKPDRVAVTSPPKRDPQRERYAAKAIENLRLADPSSFTVQFELVCETQSVTFALSEGGSRVWFVPAQYGRRSCFKMFWGHYETAESASGAIAEIPPRLRGTGTPRVVRVGEIKR